MSFAPTPAPHGIAGPSPAHTATTRDRVRAIVVLVALPVTILGALYGSGLLTGTSQAGVGDGVFAPEATPLAPARPAFSIWSVVYLGLAAYAIWQVLPRHHADARQRQIGWLALASMVLNAAWIVAAMADLVALTVVIIVALLLTLLAIFTTLRRIRPAGMLECLVVDGTFGLYLGWVSVATVANVSAWLADLGLRPDAFEVPAAVVLLVVGAIGVALARAGQGRIAPSLAIIWGVAWIGVARATGEPQSTALAIVAAIVCVAVGAATVVWRLVPAKRAA